MASSDTGCGPVVIESDEDNSSQKELDLENDFKCCSDKKHTKLRTFSGLRKKEIFVGYFFTLFSYHTTLNF